MTAQIGVSASPDAVFAWLSDPQHARHWLAQLRRDADRLPDPGLSTAPEVRSLRWTASPAGEMRVTGEGGAAEIHLVLDRPARAAANDPPEADALDDPDAGAEDALRSIKSHVENVGGGDPTTHDPREVPARLMGGSATFDPAP